MHRHKAAYKMLFQRKIALYGSVFVTVVGVAFYYYFSYARSDEIILGKVDATREIRNGLLFRIKDEGLTFKKLEMSIESPSNYGLLICDLGLRHNRLFKSYVASINGEKCILDAWGRPILLELIISENDTLICVRFRKETEMLMQESFYMAYSISKDRICRVDK